MGQLSTHVLDQSRGGPAKGVRIALYRITGDTHRKIAEAETNSDGRTDHPLLEGPGFEAGHYQIVFFAGAYLRASGAPLADPPFLDEIPIRFSVAHPEQKYHVPLLLSAHGYATYRGS